MCNRGGETAATDGADADECLPYIDQDPPQSRHHHGRTHTSFARWGDLDEIAAEGDRMVGDDVAEAGIESLKAIYATKRRIVRRICV
jgi:hypothetical protein